MKTFPQQKFATRTAARGLLRHQPKPSPDTFDNQGTAESRLNLLLDVAHIVPWEADFASSRFTYVGGQAEEILGYEVADWCAPNFWSSHLHPDDRERAIREAAKESRDSERYELEYRMIAKDGRVVWLHSLVSVTHINGEPVNVRGFSIDVSRSRQAEATLRELSGRLINAQEEERSRVARELHDDLSQRMALLSIELEQIADAVNSSAKMRRRFESLQNQAQEISSDIHRLSYSLHPSKLDHLGLSAAIKSLCEQINASGKLRVYLHQQSSPEMLPKAITLCLFRIAQETLRNAVKHSQATHVRVIVQMSRNEVRLSVIDDGCGFEMKSASFAEGLGFVSMRERLRIVGGELEISSQRAHGTRIEVTIPLDRGSHALKAAN
jgi:PAS domain S-box-containing protein